MELSRDSLSLLSTNKNLLAFSGGSDSSALFFKLLGLKIDFDIAIVDYGIRDQSKLEVKYAQELAKKFDKKIFIKNISLKNSNFEHNARVIRYEFFESLLQEYGYQNLITAHHLNDKFEWMMMQISRGTGLVEMLGFEEIEDRKNYKVLRPLINTSKGEITSYLTDNKIKYFLDESNTDTKYKRNQIRLSFCDEFIDSYSDGVKKSFKYLHMDKKYLSNFEIIYEYKNLYILKNCFDEIQNIRNIDKILKRMGYVLSSLQRQEVLNTSDCVIGGKISVCILDDLIFIAPFKEVKMSKEFKEECRVLKIPPKIRSYVYEEGIFYKMKKVIL